MSPASSPPASRVVVCARNARYPSKSNWSSGSSSHMTSNSSYAFAVASARLKSQRGESGLNVSTRQPWFASHAICKRSPTASRTTRTSSTSSANVSCRGRSLIAVNPASSAASASSARCFGSRTSPNDAYAGIFSRAPPRYRYSGSPAAFAARSKMAASMNQTRRPRTRTAASMIGRNSAGLVGSRPIRNARIRFTGPFASSANAMNAV